MPEQSQQPFALTIWACQRAEYKFKSDLEQAGLDEGGHYERLGWDEYDNSIEFYEVNNDVRLSVERQKIVFDAGFSKAYVNHKDSWETHYAWEGKDFVPVRGWRRYMEHYAKPGPSGVIGFRLMKISYWPEAWKGSHLEKELVVGKIIIVPDPLEPQL